MEVIGIILAGGKSSRMGTDKGLVDLNGKPMIQYIIDTMESLNLPILIIANNDEYLKFGYPVHKDLIPELGPVGGIYTALTKTETAKNIVVSCDTPFVSKMVLGLLIEASKNQLVTVAEFNDRMHPLIGVYDKNALDTFRKSIDNNQLKMQLINKELNVKIISLTGNKNLDAMVFKNINTKEELNTLAL